MPLGVNDLKQFAMPAGWDGGEMSKYALVDGTNYDELVTDIAAALVVADSAMKQDPRYGGMISESTEKGVEYRDGTSNGMQERTEYVRGDTKRGKTIGHMLPEKSYDRVLGWTFDFLRKARRSQLDADIADALYDVKNNWQQKLLTRFFSNADNVIATSGYDAAFVNASATAAIAYTPPSYDGTDFASSHTHFDRKAATGEFDDALEAGAKHLQEHGIMAPYLAIVPNADIATYTALDGFVRPDRGFQYIRSDSGANWAVAQMDDMFLGVYESDYGAVYLWATGHLPTNYLGLYKSYGFGDQRNPLRVLYSADLGSSPVLMRGEGFRQFPLENAVIIHEFGVGVSARRLNGYACYFAAAGSYTAPTIT